MNITFKDLLAVGSLAIGLAAAPSLNAQTVRQPDGTATTTAPSRAPAADTARDQNAIVDANSLETGANSFTEGQVRDRLEAAGLTSVQGLTKNENGIWSGRAMRGGTSTEVAMDFRGRIAAGTGVAAVATRGSAGTATSSGTQNGATTSTTGATMGTTGTTMGTTTGSSGNAAGSMMSTRPDGTPGNPPSTATGRAVDRMQGETPRPDGTPGNPAGTAAGRAMDRALGTDTTGTNQPATTPTR